MTRQILFQAHWFLGITAGLVLALMGVTGALMSFQDEIIAALSPSIVTIAPSQAPRLSPDALVAQASAQRGELGVATLTLQADPARTPRITFAPKPRSKERGESTYADPYTGKLLGEATGESFFAFVETLHRWLALPGEGNGIGGAITGASAIALIYFALSGLYLRWPREPLDWRAWLVLDLRKSGRNLYRALHAVIGGWVLVFYLVSALTGLWWSYDWYRTAVRQILTGESEREEAADRASGGTDSAVVLAPAWRSFLRASEGRFENVRIAIPTNDKPVVFRALQPGARHDRMFDEYQVDARSGAVIKADPYAFRDWGKTITTSVFEIHRGAFFGLAGRIALLLTSLTMPLFTVTGFLLYLARRRKKKAIGELDLPAALSLSGRADTLIVHASQTGGAIRLARLTAAAFENAPVVPLAQLDTQDLSAAKRALFIVSTYGDGEPPDMVRAFARRTMARPAPLADLDYAVLALGDREYPRFCAFGHEVDHWLHAGGARRLFDMIEMDGEDADAHGQWPRQIAAIGARNDLPGWKAPADGRWRLIERRLLNPGSQGYAAFHIGLERAGDAADKWQPGDIAEVAPLHDPARIEAWLDAAGLEGVTPVNGIPLFEHLARAVLPEIAARGISPDDLVRRLRALPHREYSIASIQADGPVELLVRQVRDDAGALGLASGWLTHFAPLGSEIAMRLRANPNFRPPEVDAPMILIGNGAGLAGLLAHLRHRAATGTGPNWLLFGERSAAFDAFHDEELQALRSSGVLDRLDRTWSRDAGCGRYVQAALDEAKDDLRRWVERGAAIFVCGSIAGMAPAVDASLRAALGDERVEQLIAVGRYRRDIY